jgi:hypothetical protein
MAMRKPGVYVALSANYADDEAIMDAGEDAELMYVRMLAYAARTPQTEGWISDRVLMSRLGILARAAGNGAGTEPGTDAGSRAAKLAEVGLITREGEGYRIVSWLKWNRSAEEMGRERARDASRKGAPTSANDGTDAGTDAGNGAGLPAASPLADQITDTDQKQGKQKRGTRIPDDFTPDEDMRLWAKEHTPNVDIDAETPEFVDYWRGVAGQKGVRLDWVGVWRNSMRTKQKWAAGRPGPSSVVTPINHNQWMSR